MLEWSANPGHAPVAMVQACGNEPVMEPWCQGYHREFLRMGFLSHRHPKPSSRDHDLVLKPVVEMGSISRNPDIETFQLGECWPCWSVNKECLEGLMVFLGSFFPVKKPSVVDVEPSSHWVGDQNWVTFRFRRLLGRHLTGLSSFFPMKMEKHWKTIPLFCSNPDKSFIN